MKFWGVVNGRFGKKVLNRPYLQIWRSLTYTLISLALIHIVITVCEFFTSFFNYVFWGINL
nr:MAG TPA: hypothetical protein [Caudoviricetes sp.]